MNTAEALKLIIDRTVQSEVAKIAKSALSALSASAEQQPDAYNRKLRQQLEQEWAEVRKLKEAYSAPQASQPVVSKDTVALTDADINQITLDSIGKWPSFEAQSWACKVAHAALSATSQPSEAEIRAQSQIDELGKEIARLQDALAFWLPNVPDTPGEMRERIANDAYLLVGMDGNLPDNFKCAEELGWIKLQDASQEQQAPAVQKCQHDFHWFGDQAKARRCVKCNALEQAPAVQERDREADRNRFTDPLFNKWLDETISDAGHTVWDQIGDTAAAWAGWENRPFYSSGDRQRWQNLDFDYNDKNNLRTFHATAFDAGFAAASHPAPAQTGGKTK